jgi:hypothetical protein
MWANPPICTPTVHPLSEENGILDVDLSSKFWSIVGTPTVNPFLRRTWKPRCGFIFRVLEHCWTFSTKQMHHHAHTLVGCVWKPNLEWEKGS